MHEQHNQQLPEKERHTGLCQQFVANAAVAGDQFVWHVDADPADVPHTSRWVSEYGLYTNRVCSFLHHVLLYPCSPTAPWTEQALQGQEAATGAFSVPCTTSIGS